MNAIYQTPPTIALFTPLKVLWCWLSLTFQKQADRSAQRDTKYRGVEHRSASTARVQSCVRTVSLNVAKSAPKPLRVLRVLDADQKPSQVGRMRISGRMADVCAELDRLAAFESA